MFDKIIIGKWVDPRNHNQYIITVDDNGVFMLSEVIRELN